MNDVFPYTLAGDPDVLAQVSNSLATTAEDVRACERTTTSVHMGAATMSGSFATALGDRATETSEALTGFGLVLDAGSQALAEYASALKRTQESAREAGSRYRAAADAEQQHNATALYYRSLADAGLGTSFAADQAEADAYTARATDSSLTQQQREAALTELTALLEAHGEESAFTDTLFAATSTNSMHQLLGALSTSPPGSGAGASTASTDLRDAFGRWVAAQPEAGQRRIGIELWEAGDASGSMTDWAWVSFLYRSPDLPAATYEAAAQHVESDDETLGWVQPVAPGVWHDHPAAAVLGGLARHPSSALTFLTPSGNDAVAQERIASWSEIPGGKREFATAFSAAVVDGTTAMGNRNGSDLFGLGTEVLAGGEFIHTAGPETTKELTAAFLPFYGTLREPGRGGEPVANFNSADVITIIATTSRSNESGQHWLSLSEAATREHLENPDVPTTRLFESHGLVAGALERAAIENSRSNDQAVAVGTLTAGAVVGIATAGAGTAATVAIVGATTAGSAATNLVDFEGNTVDAAGVRCITQFENLTEIFGDSPNVTGERRRELSLNYLDASKESAGVPTW